MQEIFATIKKVAASDATVLISGESGTGKELIAKAIHQASDRAQNQFVIVNCAAIPKDLLESELFGHITGAFTGAVKNKIGKFVLADGGTIFLDEIGDLHIELQAKLLRVLQERVVEPVGSVQNAVDVRVIAATRSGCRRPSEKRAVSGDSFYRCRSSRFLPPLRAAA